MTVQDHLKRARGLLHKGRFQRKMVKALPTLRKIDAQGHWVEAVFYEPYMDESTQQLVFVAADEIRTSPYTLLVFSKRDYGYGADSTFVWADHDEEWS